MNCGWEAYRLGSGVNNAAIISTTLSDPLAGLAARAPAATAGNPSGQKGRSHHAVSNDQERDQVRQVE